MRGGHRILPRYSAAVLGRAARSPILVRQRVLSKMDGSPTLGDRTAMSALGQKQTCAAHKLMSALPPIATAKANFRKRSRPLYPRKRTCATLIGNRLLGKSAIGSPFIEEPMTKIHLFYEAHRGAMEAAMHQRLDLAEGMLRERTQLSDMDRIRQEVMEEFEIVLTQMPYVGG